MPALVSCLQCMCSKSTPSSLAGVLCARAGVAHLVHGSGTLYAIGCDIHALVCPPLLDSMELAIHGLLHR